MSLYHVQSSYNHYCTQNVELNKQHPAVLIIIYQGASLSEAGNKKILLLLVENCVFSCWRRRKLVEILQTTNTPLPGKDTKQNRTSYKRYRKPSKYSCDTRYIILMQNC